MGDLTKRVLVTLVLLPVGIAAIMLGGWLYVLLILLIIGLAAWEYVNLFEMGSFQPDRILVVLGSVALAAARYLGGHDLAGMALTFLALAAMVAHMITFERGRTQAAADFASSLGGILYMGWIGGYLISLRMLPGGEWWVLVALPATWMGDMAAFFIGKRFGRHKLSPRLSPKKTWEGYWAGVLMAMLGGAFFAWLWRAVGLPSPVLWLQGALLGLVLGLLTTLGDLGESMIKRMVGAKDSGTLLPGHGGVFDRIDSWLWAGVLSYYMITMLWV
jgi:phosphatidate cytidylyltransferase